MVCTNLVDVKQTCRDSLFFIRHLSVQVPGYLKLFFTVKHCQALSVTTKEFQFYFKLKTFL